MKWIVDMRIKKSLKLGYDSNYIDTFVHEIVTKTLSQSHIAVSYSSVYKDARHALGKILPTTS